MSENTAPHGYPTIAPSMNFENTAEAIDFYTRAFGAVERYRLEAPNGGVMHAEMTLGDSIMLMSDAMAEYGAPSAKAAGVSPTLLSLTVDDVDAVFQQAVEAGAKELSPVTDYCWGHRTGSLLDPFGYRWSVTTVTEKLTPEEIKRRVAETYGASDETK